MGNTEQPGQDELNNAIETILRASKSERTRALREITRSLFLGEGKQKKESVTNPWEFIVDYDADKSSLLDLNHSVDDEDNTFHGECGVLMEKGVLQLWLFDKNDIKTETTYFYYGKENKPEIYKGSQINDKNLIDLSQSVGNMRFDQAVHTKTLKVSIVFASISYKEANDGSGRKEIKSFSAKITVSKNSDPLQNLT